MKQSKQTFSFLLFFIVLLGWAVIGRGEATAEPTPITPVAQTAYASLPHPATPPGCASAAETLMANSLNTPITDLNTITSTLEITGLPSHLWDVNLFTNIQHTYPGDLDISLISPAGTEVTITTDNLGTNDHAFANTWWDDQWVGPSIADWPLATVEVVSPEEAMGAFIGEDPNGTWQLVIHDDQAGDVGTLVAWGLSFNALSQTPQFQTYNRSFGVASPIPDLGVNSKLRTLPDYGTIYDVNTQIEMNHPRTADLDMYLISQGITITLASGVGGAVADGFNQTLWDDSAGVAVTDWQFEGSAATLVPENAMAALNGLPSEGDWRLVVEDDTPGNVGNLVTWSLSITTATCEGDAAVELWQWPYPAPVGGDITYAVVVSNQGVNPLSNVVLTDTLPVSTTFKSWTAAPGWTCQTPAVGSTGGQVVCTTPSLAGGEVVTHYLALAIGESLPTTIADNHAVVSTDDPEIRLSNNQFWARHYVGLTSANGNVWDVIDNRHGWGTYADGSIADGGQDAFDISWSRLWALVMDAAQTELANQRITSLNMAYEGDRTWTSQNSQTAGEVSIQRQLFTPSYADYVRYVDRFTNESNEVRHVSVAWGGNLGSDAWTTLAATSSGDLLFDMADEWGVTIQNKQFNPTGPAENAPVGYLWRGQGDTSYEGTANYHPNPFASPWPGNGEEDLGFVFNLTLQPGETATLVYFLYRGLAEEVAGPGNTDEGRACFINCVVPPAGSQIALAQTVLGQLAAEPDFCGLSADVLATVVNWPNATSSCPAGYPIYLPLVVR